MAWLVPGIAVVVVLVIAFSAQRHKDRVELRTDSTASKLLVQPIADWAPSMARIASASAQSARSQRWSGALAARARKRVSSIGRRSRSRVCSFRSRRSTRSP